MNYISEQYINEKFSFEKVNKKLNNIRDLAIKTFSKVSKNNFFSFKKPIVKENYYLEEFASDYYNRFYLDEVFRDSNIFYLEEDERRAEKLVDNILDLEQKVLQDFVTYHKEYYNKNIKTIPGFGNFEPIESVDDFVDFYRVFTPIVYYPCSRFNKEKYYILFKYSNNLDISNKHISIFGYHTPKGKLFGSVFIKWYEERN